VHVTIHGQDFQAGCSASLDAISLLVDSCSPTSILARVPADVPLGALPAGVYDLTVTNPDSQSDTLSDAYSAINPTPLVFSISPAVAERGTTPDVTISGSNFRNVPGGLNARVGGIPLTNLTYIDPTQLQAQIPAGLGLGVHTVEVVNPGPTNPTGSLEDAFTVYTTPGSCSPTPLCEEALGPPDGQEVPLACGETITLYFGAGQGINDLAGYDMVLYEWPNPPGIHLDFMILELSADGTTWYRVFAWDGAPGGVEGTNVDDYAIDGDGEVDNEQIPSGELYPPPVPPDNLNTGVAIDVQAWVPPGSGPFDWVRIIAPPGCGDATQIDSILKLH
jgi:hypothetical protein